MNRNRLNVFQVPLAKSFGCADGVECSGGMKAGLHHRDPPPQQKSKKNKKQK